MLIVSKFIDYYDSVAHSKGVDKTIVYKRAQSNSNEDFSKYQPKKRTWYDRGTSLPTYNWYYGHSFNSPRWEAKVILVGFCGKIYPVAYVRDRGIKTATMQDSSTFEFIFGYDNIVEKFKDFYKAEKKKKYSNKFQPREFELVTSLINAQSVKDIFVNYKTPIFLIDTVHTASFVEPNNGNVLKNVLINPCLKDVEFYKQIDPFMAFQEIEMYISGVLGIDSQKTLEVSDKSKIEGHGFDYKWSFRKEKEDKNKPK